MVVSEIDARRSSYNPFFALAKQRLDTFRTALSSATATPSSVRAIRAEIQADLDAIDAIKFEFAETLDNATLFVPDLPAEVLCTIFELVAQTCRPCGPVNVKMRNELFDNDNSAQGSEVAEPQWLQRQGGSLGWIRLGHVSKTWRRTLLAHASLWANDVGSLPDGIEEMLARSAALPLTIRTYGSSYRDSSASCRTLLREDVRSRVRKIYCVETRSGYMFDDQYAALTTCHFPALEILWIAGNERAARDDHSLPVISAPRIRELKFTNVFIPVSSKVIEDVNCALTFDADGQDTIMDRDMIRPLDLLSLLVGSRESLTTLVLDNCLPGQLRDWNTGSLVSLPKIRFLAISRAFNDFMEFDYVNFLRGLELNAETLLNIELLPPMLGDDDDVLPFQESIRRAIASVSISGIDAMSCVRSETQEREDNLHLQLFSPPISNSGEITHARSFSPLATHRRRLDMRTPIEEYAATFPNIMSPIRQALSLENIGLVICGGSFSFDQVHDLLRLCTGCHTLQIVNAHRKGAACLRALGESTPADLLPCLQHLWLTHSPRVDQHARHTPPRLSINTLFKHLSARRGKAIGMGGMPTSLTIDASVVFAETAGEVEAMMLKLTEMVPTTDWRRT